MSEKKSITFFSSLASLCKVSLVLKRFSLTAFSNCTVFTKESSDRFNSALTLSISRLISLIRFFSASRCKESRLRDNSFSFVRIKSSSDFSFFSKLLPTERSRSQSESQERSSHLLISSLSRKMRFSKTENSVFLYE